MFTRGDLIAIQGIMAALVTLRGLDYASTLPSAPRALEAVLPMGAWALWCLTVAGLILLGLVARCHVIVWLGHACGVLLYLGLLSTYLLEVFSEWPPASTTVLLDIPYAQWLTACLIFAALPVGAYIIWSHFDRKPYLWPMVLALILALFSAILHPVPIDNLRAITGVSPPLWLHLLFMMRHGPRPLPDDEAEEIQTVVAEG